MKKLFCLLLILAISVLPAAARAEFDLEASSSTACQALLSGEYAQVIAMLNDTTAAMLNEDTLSQTMAAISAQYGALTAVSGAEYHTEQRAAVFALDFANGSLDLSMAFDADGKLAGLNLTPRAVAEAVERALPEGVSEQPVTLYPGSERSLSGLVVSPENADENTPYVIFIHGSGASDMDETMGPNKIFRDLAYDLAALGVGSLRFDKITYSHPELFTGVVTVSDEYLEPVREAMRVLRENSPSKNIFAAGHSLGGMLTPWLVNECGFSGGISLAGTPLPLWQMSYEQNMLLIDTMPADQQPALIAQVDAEREKALSIKTMSDAEAESTTVFGMNAMYLKSIDLLDQCAIAQESLKPFLFIRGEADVQVSLSAFEAWKTVLPEDGAYTYISYPGLNHMFMPAEEGDSLANVQAAYSRPASVPAFVAGDIAAWINSI